MKIKVFVFNSFYENTYVVSSDQNEGFIIDPGCYHDSEINVLTNYIESNDIKIKAIINTHCHIDHVLGNEFCKKKFETPLWVPKGELDLLESMTHYAPVWGITNYIPSKPDKLLDEGMILELGDIKFKCIEVSGHSPGHLIYLEEKKRIIFGGDVLFRESIGRTDLPGGNHKNLIDNIRKKIFSLNDDITVYPGHGTVTTIGYEKKHNPFLI